MDERVKNMAALIGSVHKLDPVCIYLALYLDHVVVVAGSSDLLQHQVQLVVHDQPTHVVEGSSKYTNFVLK